MAFQGFRSVPVSLSDRSQKLHGIRKVGEEEKKRERMLLLASYSRKKQQLVYSMRCQCVSAADFFLQHDYLRLFECERKSKAGGITIFKFRQTRFGGRAEK
jgi:hypothetical protein